jgi:hypothetical protein
MMVLVAVAAALEALAMLSAVPEPVPTLRMPPLMFKVESEALPVPVLAELFVFMLSVLIVVVLPEMFTVESVGPLVAIAAVTAATLLAQDRRGLPVAA